MSGRQSSATDKALKLLGKPRRDGKRHTLYSAAKLAGINYSTIYRAVKRQRKS